MFFMQFQVSVARDVPPISDGYLQDQPEDWVAAFPEVTSAYGLAEEGSVTGLEEGL